MAKWNDRKKLKEPAESDKWFWVDKKEIVDNKYDLSINRYKKIVHKAVEYEKPEKIIKDIKKLEAEIMKGVEELEGMV